MFAPFMLFLTLVVLAGVGHLIWVGVAWVIRSVFGYTSANSATRQSSKPPESDIQVFRRVLDRMQEHGYLESDERVSLVQKMDACYATPVDVWRPEPIPVAVPGANLPKTIEPVEATRVHEPIHRGTLAPTVSASSAKFEQPILASLCDEDSLCDDAATVDELQQTPAMSNPATSRQSWAAIIESFLAVHNIRWGELVAGLLIVVCSIGLVISLWSTLIDAHRVLPSLIFLGANASIFAAGFYTLAKWKLRHTSRAVLLIATLLVPLSVLAGLATASQGRAAVSLSDLSVLLTILGGTATNVFLISRAGRALFGRSKAWPFAIAVASPAGMIPLVPAVLRTFGENAGFLIAGASVAVAIAIVWFQAPWRYHRTETRLRARRLLVAGSRHQWTFLFVAGFSIASLAITLAYMGREFGSDLWYAVVVSLLPAITVASAAAQLTHRRSAIESHQFFANVARVLGIGMAMLALPMFAAEPGWLWMWAITASACWLGCWRVFRDAPWLTMATIPTSLAVLISSSCVMQQVEWDALSWPRRLVGGEPMLTSGLIGILNLVLLSFNRRNAHASSLSRLARTWFAFACLNAAVLVFAPASWLGIVPEYALTIIVGVLAVASVIAAVTAGLPASVTIGLAILVACAALHPLRLASGVSIAGATVWTQALLLAASILTTVYLLIPSIRLVVTGRLGHLSLARSKKQWAVVCMTQWCWAAATLAALATIVAMTQMPDDPVFAGIASGVAALILLIAGYHLRDRVWMLAAQASTFVVGCSFVRHFYSDAFFPSLDLRSGHLFITSEPQVGMLWNWSVLLAVLGWLWIALEVWGHHGWYPIRTAGQRKAGHSPMVDYFPRCWFVAGASVLLVMASLVEFLPLITRREWFGITHASTMDLRDLAAPLIGFTLILAAIRWLRTRETIANFWRETSALTQIALLVWGTSQLAYAFDLETSNRLILVTTIVMAALAASRMLPGRWSLSQSQFALSGFVGLLLSSTASLFYYGWLKPIAIGSSPGLIPTLSMSAWWLIVATGLLVSSLRQTLPERSMLSAMIFPLACTLVVPAISNLPLIAWFQVAGLATLVWALIAHGIDRWMGNSQPTISSSAKFAVAVSMAIGTTAGLFSAGIGLLHPLIASGLAANPLLNVVSFILTSVAIGNLTLRGLRESSLLGSLRQTRLPWPIAISLMSGQVAWILMRLAPPSQLGGGISSATIEFTLLFVASASSLYRYLRTRESVDAWHIGILACFAVIASETTASLSPIHGLAFVTVLGILVAFRCWADKNDESNDWTTRVASWIVIAAGVWMIWRLPSGSNQGELLWTYSIAWSCGWMLTWQIVSVPQNRVTASTSTDANPSTPQSNPWAELVVIAAVISAAEVFAQSLSLVSNRSMLPSFGQFVVRFALLELLAFGFWLRSQQWGLLATCQTLSVAWFAAATIAIGNALGWSDSDTLMISILTCSFLSAMLAFTVTPLAQLQELMVKRTTSTCPVTLSSHAFATLVPLGLSAAASIVGAFCLYFANAPLSLVQLSIGGMVICAVGVSELAERLDRASVRDLAMALGLSAVYAWSSVGASVPNAAFLGGAMRWLIVSVWLIPAILWGLPRLAGSSWAGRWSTTLRRSAIVVGCIGVVSLAVMLSLEAIFKNSDSVTRLPMALVAAVALSIGGLSALSAIVALASGPTLQDSHRVPSALKLTLADTHRRWLLVAAQVCGVLTWMHVFFCKPHFALIGLRAYWPYIVMAIAFVSVGIVEWVRRRSDDVIAKTLTHTSLYLPLIPIVGLLASGDWMGPTSRLVSTGPSLSIVLVIAAGYYLFVSRIWEGWIPRVLMVVFANSAIWSWLVKHPEWSFLQHPQLWLIPPAACVLVLAQRYRHDIDAKFLSSVRYGATLMIYVSSTANMMIQHIGTTLWGPVVLILLALAGMAAGVVLRIRPFLYLGTLFVLLGVTSMVWHAQRSIDQVWPWWVFGITTGIGLLAGLMSIEKNKGKLQELSLRLNSWES